MTKVIAKSNPATCALPLRFNAKTVRQLHDLAGAFKDVDADADSFKNALPYDDQKLSETMKTLTYGLYHTIRLAFSLMLDHADTAPDNPLKASTEQNDFKVSYRLLPIWRASIKSTE